MKDTDFPCATLIHPFRLGGRLFGLEFDKTPSLRKRWGFLYRRVGLLRRNFCRRCKIQKEFPERRNHA